MAEWWAEPGQDDFDKGWTVHGDDFNSSEDEGYFPKRVAITMAAAPKLLAAAKAARKHLEFYNPEGEAALDALSQAIADAEANEVLCPVCHGGGSKNDNTPCGFGCEGTGYVPPLLRAGKDSS